VAEATSLAHHLAAMVGQMRHHAKAGRVGISLRHACSNADAAPDVLLAELSRAVSQQAATIPAASAVEGAAAFPTVPASVAVAAVPSPATATAPA
jgi:hypothetical protein